MSLRLARALALGTLMAAPLLSQAASLEEVWRSFLDRNPKLSGLVRPYGAEVTTPTVAKRTDTLPLGTNRWVVFVAPGCRSCGEAVANLKSRGGNVEVMDIAASKTAREAFAATDAKGFPALLIGGYLVTGWSVPAFERAVISNVQDQSRNAQGF